MDMGDIQKKIVEFAEKKASMDKSELLPELSYIRLTEEMGKVAKQLFNKKVRPNEFDKVDLAKQIVDVILEASLLANLCEVDLNKEVSEKIDALFKKYGFEQNLK